MLFPIMGSFRMDTSDMSTNLFQVFLASVVSYLVFIYMTSIHFSVSVLVMFRDLHPTFITSLPPVFMHLPHSTGIHLPCSAVNDATTSSRLLFLEDPSPILFPQSFHSSLITCTSILQHVSP